MNSADYQQLFFSTIQRAPGQPADDYEAVLGASGIPAGYKPYVVPDCATMPFHAMTQQIGTDGRIAGRIFLPASGPDENGYYTHPFSPLKDGPTPGSLVWEWRDLGIGQPVADPCGSAGGEGGEGGGTGLTEAQVQAMIDAAIAPMQEQLAGLDGRVYALEAAASQPFHAHGAVNLPIVVESLTSMRAKGDIDVDVKPGTAMPPPETGGGDEISGAKLLFWLRRRNDDDEAEG